MPRVTDTRERVLNTSVKLFRRQGYSATGLKQIVDEGEAPFGSIYHFFPGGKEQIAAEALQHAGSTFGALVGPLFEQAKDAGAAAEAWFSVTADALERSDFTYGCPIGSVALEVASTSDGLRARTAEVFSSWEDEIADALVADGVRRARARKLASFALSAFEGALMLSRAKREAEPLRTSGRMVADAVRAAIS